MKHFRRLRESVEVGPFLAEIESVPGAWDLFPGRQNIRVQREAKAIPLRGLRKSKIAGRKRRDVHESRDTTTSRRFPHAMAFIRWFADEIDGELGRAKLVALPPGHRVHPHIDRGEYYRARNRYHLVLQSPKGSLLRCGDEQVRMGEGELWWFDNDAMHDAVNDADVDRIHLIFDVRVPLEA